MSHYTIPSLLFCLMVSPPLHPSRWAPSVCSPEGCRRRFCPSSDTLCSCDLYLCTSTSLFLSPPVSFCPIHFYFLAALAHCPFLFFLYAFTHIHLQMHARTHTREHTRREIALSLAECRGEVSNPVPGRVGLLGD